MKRIIQFLVCLCIGLGFFLPTDIQAASQPGSYPSSAQLVTNQVSRSFTMYDAGFYGMENPLTVPGNEFSVSKFAVDNQVGYCVQPDMSYYPGSLYTNKLTGNDAFQALKKNYKGLGYSDSEIARMQQISSVGYGYGSDTSNDLYAATQIMMWKVKHPNDIQVSNSAIQNKMKEIEARLQVFSKKVSFQNSSVTLKGYGKENAVVLNDSQQVFSYYNLTTAIPNGLHVEKDKNKLTIWADQGYQQAMSLKFDALYGSQGVNNALTVYTVNTSQTLATFGRISAPSMNVNVTIDIHASKGNLVITKSAPQLVGVKMNESEEVDQFIYEERGLVNTEFDLMAKEDIIDPVSQKVVVNKGDLVAHLVTDENGQCIASDLYFGTYVLKEVKVPQGFVLNDQEQTIEINDKQTFNKVIEQQAPVYDEKQNVAFIIITLSSTDKKPIEGAVFELVSNESIMDAQGNVLITQGQKIKTLTSDKKGNIQTDLDLPISSYSLQEVQAPSGHQLLEQPLLIDAKTITEKENAYLFEQEIENTFIPLSLKVQKVDKENQKLIDKEVEIGLYADKETKKLIQSQKGKKEVIFKDLQAGTYYVKEIKAPDGYVLSTQVHAIQITRNGQIYIDGDKSEKSLLKLENEKEKEKTIVPIIPPTIFTGTQRGTTGFLLGIVSAFVGMIALIIQKKKK